MTERPKQASFRLSDDDRELLAALSKAMGVNQTSVIKLAIRDKAKAEGVTIKASHADDAPKTGN